MSGGGGARDSATERFALADWRAEFDTRWLPCDPETAVCRLTDPGAARGTLHWGRNYLYAMDLRTVAGELPVVVKQFRNEGLRARLRLRLRGSKAERSWRTARAMEGAGLPTPAPVAWIESNRFGGPSLFVCRRVDGFFELRYMVRAILAGRETEEFPTVDAGAVLRAAGRSVRRMHDAGIWHRDLSIGNILVSVLPDEPASPRLQIIDLDRARLDAKIGFWRRMRDLCRLPLLAPETRRALLGGYLGDPERVPRAAELAFRLLAHGFLLRNRLKAAARAPFSALVEALVPRRAYPHIPPAPPGLAVRDRVVWDHLSDQPHQHAGRLGRVRVRVADSMVHGRAAVAGLSALPRVVRRERELLAGLWREPVPFGEAGVALRPRPEGDEEQLRLLDELGVRHVVLRLHPWQDEHDAELALARALVERGIELTFVLAQNRDLTREPLRWRSAIEGLGDLFLPYGRRFQIGQAINRSKWGIWNYAEYLDLAEEACAALRSRGDVFLLGPGIIDFELHAYLSLLNMRRPGVRFDGLGSLLYVDRRGAPENRQLGYDTLGKVVVLKAIADRSEVCGDAFWITEYNWPLWEGPHSPAGRDVAVDEERQASYLVRYCVLTLGSGLVQRAYWWQLVARGYGLVDAPAGGEPRRRPAFLAMRQMVAALAGSSLERPLEASAEAYMFLFRDRAGDDLLVGWAPERPASRRLPRPAAGAVDRDGRPIELDDPEVVELTQAPRYFRLNRS